MKKLILSLTLVGLTILVGTSFGAPKLSSYTITVNADHLEDGQYVDASIPNLPYYNGEIKLGPDFTRVVQMTKAVAKVSIKGNLGITARIDIYGVVKSIRCSNRTGTFSGKNGTLPIKILLTDYEGCSVSFR